MDRFGGFWRRSAAVTAALALALSLASCGGSAEKGESADPQLPTESTAQSSTPAPDPGPVLDLVKDGRTDYTLVYDDTDDLLVEMIEGFCRCFEEKCGVALPRVGSGEGKPAGEKEILVGAVRDSAKPIRDKVAERNDFIIEVQDDDLVLYAEDTRMYHYLFDVLEDKVLRKAKDGRLQMSAAQNVHHAASKHKDVTYVEYLKNSGHPLTGEQVLSFFTPHMYLSDSLAVSVYRLYVPFDYDPGKKYPVLLFLHGAGERGDDNSRQLANMMTALFSQPNAAVEDAIIVAPQCPNGSQWVDTPWSEGNYSVKAVPESDDLSAAVEVVTRLGEDYSVDTARRYVMGLSMGGFGTWDCLMRHPEVFAAGLPICGGADPAMAPVLRDMPIHTFHGSVDSIVPVEGTREMAAALKKAGSQAVYTELEGRDHGIWEAVASDPKEIGWLFSQHK